jgi:hypothetical protein
LNLRPKGLLGMSSLDSVPSEIDKECARPERGCMPETPGVLEF